MTDSRVEALLREALERIAEAKGLAIAPPPVGRAEGAEAVQEVAQRALRAVPAGAPPLSPEPDRCFKCGTQPDGPASSRNPAMTVCRNCYAGALSRGAPEAPTTEARMCQACTEGDHANCGMQTWCECDCPGPDGDYFLDDDEDNSLERGAGNTVPETPRNGGTETGSAVDSAKSPTSTPQALTAGDLGRMALIGAALQVHAIELKKRDESTVFDIATDTGIERLEKVLEAISWASPAVSRGPGITIQCTTQEQYDACVEALRRVEARGPGPTEGSDA